MAYTGATSIRLTCERGHNWLWMPGLETKCPWCQRLKDGYPLRLLPPQVQAAEALASSSQPSAQTETRSQE